MALGAYQATPLEMSGAYTIFANEGVYVRPVFLARIRDAQGREVSPSQPETRRVLDPSAAYAMVDMLQEVVRNGTATAVNNSLKTPVAAKTGTSHDGWFAGFTPNLLCVVWVGFDDYRELGLEGARSALPVWAEFMKRAVQDQRYAGQFHAPRPAPRPVVTLAHAQQRGHREPEKADNE